MATERELLIEAIRDLEVNAQGFNSRGQHIARKAVLAAFDTMAAKVAAPSLDLPADLVERIRGQVAFAREKRMLVVKLDVEDAEQLLALVAAP